MKKLTQEFHSFTIDPPKTLRDEFAMHAPDIATINVMADKEILAGMARPDGAEGIVKQLEFNALVEARMRYIYADAMLKARKS